MRFCFHHRRGLFGARGPCSPIDAATSSVAAYLVADALLVEKLNEVLGVLRAALKFNAGVNVLRVLAEDDHVDVLRLLHRRWHAW